MINQDKVNRAIELQKRANNEIDTYGRTSDSTFEEMMEAFDSLTPDEENEVIERYGMTLEDTFCHDVETRAELAWLMN